MKFNFSITLMLCHKIHAISFESTYQFSYVTSIQLIVSGQVGNPGLIVPSHAEMQQEQNAEPNRSQKNMAVNAQETRLQHSPANCRNALVRLNSMFKIT